MKIDIFLNSFFQINGIFKSFPQQVFIGIQMVLFIWDYQILHGQAYNWEWGEAKARRTMIDLTNTNCFLWNELNDLNEHCPHTTKNTTLKNAPNFRISYFI
jgi:hypothetical protein